MSYGCILDRLVQPNLNLIYLDGFEQAFLILRLGLSKGFGQPKP